jgi:hypothetical protein
VLLLLLLSPWRCPSKRTLALREALEILLGALGLGALAQREEVADVGGQARACGASSSSTSNRSSNASAA